MKYKYYLNQDATLARVYRADEKGGLTYWSPTNQRWEDSTTYPGGVKSKAFKHDRAFGSLVPLSGVQADREINQK